MKESITPGAHPQAGQAKKTASHRASSLADAFGRCVLDTIGPHKRSFVALHAQLCKVDRCLTRTELKDALGYLQRNGLIEFETHNGVAFIVPIQRIAAGRRAGSSRKSGGAA